MYWSRAIGQPVKALGCSGAVHCGIDACAHGRKFVGHAQERPKLGQNFIRPVHKLIEADAH
jgi:hypothetical protein